MKNLIVLMIAFLLAGCLGEPTIDATSEESLKASIKEIRETLPKEQVEPFNKAVMYFAVGGANLFERIGSGGEPDPAENMAVLDGKTAAEVLEMHQLALEKDREKKAAKKEASKVAEEAEALLKNRKFQEAIDAYNRLGQMPFGSEKAEIGLETAKAEMEKFQAMMAYLPLIEVTEFEAKRIDTISEKGIPAVRFSLKNNGDRSLDRVEVMVYFEDANGQTIFEKDFYPVNASSYSSGSNPLKPGYIHEMEENRYFTLDTPLTSWEAGKARLEIKAVEFSEG